MKYFVRFIFVSCLIVILSACASTVGRKFNLSGTGQIRNGVTTKTDVINMIGQPSERRTAPDGTEVWTYMYVSSTGYPGTALILSPPLGKYDIKSESQFAWVSFSGDTVSRCRVIVSATNPSETTNETQMQTSPGITDKKTVTNCDGSNITAQ